MNYLDAIKYPKTFHFDFSASLQNDDRRLESIEHFIGKQVVVSEKMDGENSNIYTDYFHPRSIIDDGHPSRSWLKGYVSKFQYLIPKRWRVCGENMYAKHSIYYDQLESFFYVFGIYNDKNICLSWEYIVFLCNQWNIVPVPVLYEGIFDYEKIKSIYESLNYEKQEGIVCRIAHSFHYDDYNKVTAKAVRPLHIQTDEHWSKTWIPNKLKK